MYCNQVKDIEMVINKLLIQKRTESCNFKNFLLFKVIIVMQSKMIIK